MAGSLNFDKAKKYLRKTNDKLADGVDHLRDAGDTVVAAVSAQTGNLKQKIQDRKTNDNDPYEEAVADYNSAFTSMSDKGMALLLQRQRSVDLIDLVTVLINSIANTPKSFETDFRNIETQRRDFLQAEDFAEQDLEAARRSATGAGIGVTAGAAVASIAPTAAMWVATTFGTASTGTAISTLSGAAASKAALAWLGGGALAAGGGGSAAGSALLAVAGPIGWSIAGTTLLTSIVLFSRDKNKNRKAKEEALTALKKNTAEVQAMELRIDAILEETSMLRERLMGLYIESLKFYNADFLSMEKAQRLHLAALVNNTLSAATMLGKHVADNTEAVEFG